MAEKLGILVSSDKHLDYLISLTGAAHKKGKEVELFFTGKGVLLTQSPNFKKLVGKAKMTLCDVSFRDLGLKGDVPGMGFKDFATQAKNADLIEKSGLAALIQGTVRPLPKKLPSFLFFQALNR